MGCDSPEKIFSKNSTRNFRDIQVQGTFSAFSTKSGQSGGGGAGRRGNRGFFNVENTGC
jgi:hypothetical protein